ncbi:MAG: DUF3575 domain-containing protein [Mediterranea sp.]|nr:DUF3575 domain-containing protein [Mediterranea sp.]
MFLLGVSVTNGYAQNNKLNSLVIKTDLLYGGMTLTPNLAIETAVSSHGTLDFSAGYHPWNRTTRDVSNKKFVHLLGKVEYRYWPSERFNKHFFGVHALFSSYNISGIEASMLKFKKDLRYQGNGYGAGLSYGYVWKWSRRWAMEFNVGAGAVFRGYDTYNCVRCGEKTGSRNDVYLGVTAAGIKLVYTLKDKQHKRYIQETPQSHEEHVNLIQSHNEDDTQVKHDDVETTIGFIRRDTLPSEATAVPQVVTPEPLPIVLASVCFRQGDVTIVPSFRDNWQALEQMVNIVRETMRTHQHNTLYIKVTGYVSPEGSPEANANVAAGRADTLAKYLSRHTGFPIRNIRTEDGGTDYGKSSVHHQRCAEIEFFISTE